jgi:transcriptional regulator with XRE-family HTH domain
MNDMTLALAERAHPLTLYRQRHKLTLAAFAALAGTTQATISRIEGGTRLPRQAMLRRLVEATGREVTADDIMLWVPDAPR